MPRTRSLAWSELRIGVLTVIALALATMLTFVVGGQGGFFWQRYPLKTRFTNVQGLKSGAVVRVAGVEVGTVTGIAFVEAEVEVSMEVHKSMRSRITAGSRASIGSVSLLGEPVVDISPSSEGGPIEDGGYVTASQSPRQLGDVAENASLGLQEVTRLLREVRDGRGTVGQLFANDALYQDIKGFVEAAENVTARLQRGEGTVGQLLTNPKAYDELVASLGNLEQMTRRIAAGEGSLGRLVQDDAMAKSLSATTANLQELTASGTPEAPVMSGRSRVIRDDDYSLTIGLPPGMRLASATARGESQPVAVKWQTHIGYASVTIESDVTQPVQWSFTFEPATTYIYPPRRPEGLQATSAADGSVHLTWRPEYYSIAGYQVEVDGVPVGVSFEPRANLRGLTPGEHRFSIREVWYDGTSGRETVDLTFTVPAGD